MFSDCPSVRACVRWLDVTFWFVNGSDVCTSRVASEMDVSLAGCL